MKHGLFILRDRSVYERLLHWLEANWKQDRPLVVEISPEASKRTALQNKYMWASLQDLAEDAELDGKRFTKEAWHTYLSRLFLYHIELPDGSTAPVSTTKLTVPEFIEYLEKINLWTSTELGIPFGKSPEEWGGY